MARTTAGISETVSENSRRGRPPRFDAAELAAAQFVSSEAITTRTLQNTCYRLRAFGFVKQWLEDFPSLRWLVDPEAQRMKRMILSELGRIRDPDEMLAIALDVCDRRPRTHEAVRLIRFWRACTADGTREPGEG